MVSALVLQVSNFFVFPKCEINLGIESEKAKKIILKSLIEYQGEIIIVPITQKKELSNKDLLKSVGVLCKIELSFDIKEINIEELNKIVKDTKKIKISGFWRVKLINIEKLDDVYLQSQYSVLEDKMIDEKKEMQILKEKWFSYISDFIGKNHLLTLNVIEDDIIKLIDYVAQNSKELDNSIKHKILNELNPSERLRLLISLPNRKKLDKEIDELAKEKIREEQENYYLLKKKEAIEMKLRKYGDDMEKVIGKLDKEIFPSFIKELVLQKADQYYKALSTNSSESNMIRSYIEWLIKIPWSKYSEEIKDLKWAKKKLDEKHYGLSQVKDRILEYLAAKIKSGKTMGQVICLLGPPGVGKTSLAAAIAEATGREFISISVGGVSDEAEIRGNRYTYIGSFPGKIIKALINAKTMNPLILVDEIDKIGYSNRGNPAHALLEVLDPQTNTRFIDNYLGDDVPCDLSKVFFICTANVLNDIPLPLYDRLEIIRLSSYTDIEKINIAKQYLIPECLKTYDIKKENVEFTDSGLLEIIEYYTRESGVRDLKNKIDTIFRKYIVQILESEKEVEKKLIIDKKTVSDFLKKKIYGFIKPKFARSGVFNGLVAYSNLGGGDVLPIEVSYYKKEGVYEITGNLGDTAKESCRVAITYVKSNAEKFGIDSDFFSKNCLHIHFMEAGMPKEGPSAGCAITTAIISAITNKVIPEYYACTGEITLHGWVQPIGGLREKTIAAQRQKIKTIFIPKENERDMDDIPKEVREKINIIPVETYDEIWEILFNDKK